MSTLDPLNHADYIRSRIRTVPDWPQAGVQFRDITPLVEAGKDKPTVLALREVANGHIGREMLDRHRG